MRKLSAKDWKQVSIVLIGLAIVVEGIPRMIVHYGGFDRKNYAEIPGDRGANEAYGRLVKAGVQHFNNRLKSDNWRFSESGPDRILLSYLTAEELRTLVVENFEVRDIAFWSTRSNREVGPLRYHMEIEGVGGASARVLVRGQVMPTRAFPMAGWRIVNFHRGRPAGSNPDAIGPALNRNHERIVVLPADADHPFPIKFPSNDIPDDYAFLRVKNEAVSVMRFVNP